jgi:hypothetical protein
VNDESSTIGDRLIVLASCCVNVTKILLSIFSKKCFFYTCLYSLSCTYARIVVCEERDVQLATESYNRHSTSTLFIVSSVSALAGLVSATLVATIFVLIKRCLDSASTTTSGSKRGVSLSDSFDYHQYAIGISLLSCLNDRFTPMVVCSTNRTVLQ